MNNTDFIKKMESFIEKKILESETRMVKFVESRDISKSQSTLKFPERKLEPLKCDNCKGNLGSIALTDKSNKLMFCDSICAKEYQAQKINES